MECFKIIIKNYRFRWMCLFEPVFGPHIINGLVKHLDINSERVLPFYNGRSELRFIVVDIEIPFFSEPLHIPPPTLVQSHYFITFFSTEQLRRLIYFYWHALFRVLAPSTYHRQRTFQAIILFFTALVNYLIII